MATSLTWRYYAPSASSIWTAPNAIQHICQESAPGGTCEGPEWAANVDLKPADFGIIAGSLNFADARAANALNGFFNLSQVPRPFSPIVAPKDAQFFINDASPQTDPDDD
jgi:hypothetical protein